MKVCLISRAFDIHSGSAEWIYSERLREELIKDNFEVYTISQKTKNSPLKKIFHDWVYLPWKIISLRVTKKVKIFHFLSENQAIFSFLARAMGAKTITYFHDLMRINSKKFSFNKLYFKLVYRMAINSNKIVCNSSSTKQELINKYSIDENKIEIIPCTHYTDLTAIRKERKVRKTIGYLGFLSNRKRVLKLEELAQEIKKRKFNYKIVVWGEGPLKDKLQRLSKEEKTEKILFVKGKAPYSSINKTYNSFDFFVFPTEEEGLGLPIIEAMSCGIPVFILKDAKIPYEVKKKCIACSSMTEMLSKITSLSKNINDYRKLSLDLGRYSKLFSAKKSFKRIINLYKRII